MQIDQHDYALLKRIKAGERVFTKNGGQPYEDFEREVLRLLRLRERRLITMPDPTRSSQTARSEYLQTGVCELTLDGHEALDRTSHDGETARSS